MKQYYPSRLTLAFVACCLLPASGAFCQTYQWANNAGGANYDEGRSITIDASGNVYITGIFEDTADFDPGAGTASLISAGERDIFFAKYDGNGNYLWAKRVGGSGYDWGQQIVVDGSGNVYLTGYFEDTVDFNPGGGTAKLISAGREDIFFAKYDANGNYLWAKRMGGGSGDYGQSLGLDQAGNVYVTGYFTDTVDFNPGAGTNNLVASGDYDIFFAKYDGNGNYLWAKKVGGPDDDFVQGLATDASGNFFITGYFTNTADFNPGAGTASLTAAGFDDVFLAKYDGSGNYLWAKRMGGSAGGDVGYGIAVDAGGNVYVTGAFQGAADFDPGSGTANLNATGIYDAFFAKYDGNGNYLWAKGIESTGGGVGLGIAADAGGSVYLGGYFTDTADFDPGAGTVNFASAGLEDIFFAKYDGSGNYLWAIRRGSTDIDWSEGIAADANGNVYITGYFAGTADFDPGSGTANLTSAGFDDIFFAKYSDATATSAKETSLSENDILIYPNPSNGQFIIRNSGTRINELEIYNALGEKIYSEKINVPKTEINLSNQPGGIYFLQIKTEQGMTERKIIIQ